MRLSEVPAATALILMFALVCLTACTDQGEFTRGDPGREIAPRTPPVDSSNATLASASPTPLSAATPAPLPQSALQPSLPAANAAAAEVAAARRKSQVFSAVTVTFSDHARELAAADPRLDSGAVAAAVEHELQAQHLFAPGSAAPVLTVLVEGFTSSLASNAMVLGYTFRNVMLIGEVIEPGADAPPPFDVHARARLTSREAGGDAGSLEPLFARFAQLAVADVRGVEPPAEALPR